MPLGPGTRLGPYEVLSAIGAGGMGEVYRARDTKLDREVAIKVLPEAFATDPERIARFQREAKTLAALNHPHIAAIYGLEDGPAEAGPHVRALVMELVEGEDLAQRIARGPVPLEEALPIAKQIAEALEAAHEQGIIHRDLKPANIKVTPNGAVKVLDFGLAKLNDPNVSNGPNGPNAPSMSPTISLQATYAGVILGTAAYMSPEQARGKAVDRRADTWAFGCVLFEMLTGRRVFDAGETVSDAIAAVLRSEPDWTALPAETPAAIRRLLRRCLQKDPQKRLPHIGIARLEIDEVGDADALREQGAKSAPVAEVAVARRGVQLAWIVTGAALVSLIAVSFPAIQHLREAPPAALPQVRTQIVTGETPDPLSFAISPDGQQLVYAAGTNGPSQLWLRTLASEGAQPLRGTEGAMYPFWSPDSRSIAFFADLKLKRLDLGSGTPQVVVAIPSAARGGAWNANGVILYALTANGILKTSTSGEKAVELTKAGQSQSHRFPQFLPDGEHFLFFAQGGAEAQGIYLGSLTTGESTRLTPNDTAGRYIAPGWVMWVRGGTLVAQRLDVEHRRLTGSTVAAGESVASDAGSTAAAVSVSSAGLIAYRGGGPSLRQLQWLDRAGRMLGVVGAPDEANLSGPRISPEGRRVVVFRIVQGNSDIWLLDGSRMTRLTFDPGLDRYPHWSPDGARVTFDSTRLGSRNIFTKAANGAGSDQLLFQSMLDKSSNDWSPDGRFLLYRTVDPQTGRDLWVLPVKEAGTPIPFVVAPFEQNSGTFSPDGRWVAYDSNESGPQEVYVRSFVPLSAPGQSGAAAPADGQSQVSISGGIFPTWRADGKEMYYVAPNGDMMAVPVAVTGCCTLEAGKPVSLFKTRMYGGGSELNQGRQYDVARDGRFLVNTIVDESAAPITILQNWKPPAD